MKFGLMFFAASEDSLGADKYRLIVESARFADRTGFSSVWVPERHFTSFGGLYPNPAVLHAALSTCTSTIRLNAGSVVAPLHHPVRIAEEWSVVDNLSNGRVGISFASGWNPNDFVFHPERYADRYEHLFATMDAVKALWRGEPYTGMNGAGQPCSVTIFPRPVQPELPVWMTVAGNPENFERAGASGANLLTHLLDQDEQVLAARIKIYRDARAAAGFDPATGEVSLMVHTLVGADAATVREQARRPYCEYIKANIGLFKGLAQSRGRDADLSSMSAADLDEFVNFLYDRFAASRGLIGTPESCAPLVSRLARAGVTELACLLDFGPATDLILSSLTHLATLKDQERSTGTQAAASSRTAAKAFDHAIVQQRCTHEMSGTEFHARLGRHGIQIDGLFQPDATIWRRDGEALARIALADSGSEYHVHPASLDACCRVLAAAIPGFESDQAATFLPTGFKSCDVRAALAGSVWVHAAIARGQADSSAFTGDVRVYGADGRSLAAIGGIGLAPVEHRSDAIDVSGLLYERVWRPSSATPAPPDGVKGRWALVADRGGVADELSKLMAAHGAEFADATAPSLRGIIYLRGLDADAGMDADTPTLESAVNGGVHDLLALAQTSGTTPIWIVTRGAVMGSGLAQAPLWGFGRGLAVERPGSLGALVDLDPALPPGESGRHLLGVLAGNRDEDMVAFQGRERFVPRLTRLKTEGHATPLALSAAGTVLITGGTGGLGLRLAEWLASRGARHLIVSSRRGPAAAALAQIERLRSSGTSVLVLNADVADETAFARELDRSRNDQPPITGVFHLAGVLDDGRIETQTRERFSAVMRAKVQGAWNLHRLTRGDALKHFVLFSSVSSLMPAPGQASYAAANAFLDGLAACRRAQGLPAITVNWGPWSGAGHATTEYGGQAHERLASLGIGSISLEQGFRSLEVLIAEDRTQAVAVAVDWPRLVQADPVAARLALLAEVVPAGGPARDDRSHQPSELLDAMRALPADERRPYILGYLSDMVIAALKLRTDEPLDPRQRLFDVGLDSIMALELKDRLERASGVKLSATLLFVHPTLESLASYFLSEIVGDAAVSQSEDELTEMLLREIDVSRGA